MSIPQVDLTREFTTALVGPFGTRPLSVFVRELIPVLAWARREGVAWCDLAEKMNSVLQKNGLPPTTAASLRGIFGRERRKMKGDSSGRAAGGGALSNPNSSPLDLRFDRSLPVDLAPRQLNPTSTVFDAGERTVRALRAIRDKEEQ